MTGDFIIVTGAGSLLLPLPFPEYTESDTDLIYVEPFPLSIPGDVGDTKVLLDIDGGVVVVTVLPTCPKVAPLILVTIFCWSSTNGTLTVLSKICLCLNVTSSSSVVLAVYDSPRAVSVFLTDSVPVVTRLPFENIRSVDASSSRDCCCRSIFDILGSSLVILQPLNGVGKSKIMKNLRIRIGWLSWKDGRCFSRFKVLRGRILS